MNEIVDQRFKKWIIVQAYKHDGKLHRQWSPAYLTVDDDDVYAVCSRASLVTEANGRKWITREHAVFIFFKKKWLNVICMLKNDSSHDPNAEKGICYYVNIATPTIMDEGKLKYIDYDLDIKLFPDKTTKELDESEFERHIKTYGYSDELTSAIKKSMNEVKLMISKGEYPFDDLSIREIYEKFLNENKPFMPFKQNRDL